MLLNLSNHPSDLWDENQLKAATDNFGKVADLPFPEISPEADSASIEGLARHYCKKVLNLLSSSSDAHSAVHLMGEMTFSYCLTGFLQQAGVRCVASTTVRKVLNNQNGQKTVNFEFRKFRDYPILCKLHKT
jgi:hypothetical protein